MKANLLILTFLTLLVISASARSVSHNSNVKQRVCRVQLNIISDTSCTQTYCETGSADYYCTYTGAHMSQTFTSCCTKSYESCQSAKDYAKRCADDNMANAVKAQMDTWQKSCQPL